MALSTRELAAFVQKVAKLQPQDPAVYGNSRAYAGCASCVPTLPGLGELGLDSVSWGSVALGAALGAGALYLVAKRKPSLLMRRSKKRAKKSRRNRRNRRR